MEMSDGNQDVPHQQVKLIGGLTGGCGGSIDGEKTGTLQSGVGKNMQTSRTLVK